MLKWIEKIEGENKTCHVKLSQLEIVCISYKHHPISFQVLIDDLYTLYFKDFESLEECKEKAEQWLKDFFMPIVKHTIAEVVGTEIFNENKLEEKASDVLDAILETISENNYIENGEQRTDTPTNIGGGDL